MTLCFSTTIPLIAPFGCLFFFIKYFVDKYNLLFVYPVEFESHGNIGFVVIKFVLLGIFFFQFIISNLFLKLTDKNYALFASIVYIIIAIFTYFISKKIFIVNKFEREDNNSVFEAIINKTADTLLNASNGFTQLRISLMQETPQPACLKKDKGTFTKLIKQAYIHPAEKDITNNPIQIWNDSYNFIKRGGNTDDGNRKFVEYEHFITRYDRENETNQIIEELL